MRKLQLLLLFLLLPITPAQAILGEDYVMLKTYLNHPQRYPKEKEALIKRFAEALYTLRPAHMQIYTNQEGRINKELWTADGQFWTQEQAQKIRDAIMLRNPSSAQISSFGITWFYSDGAQVIYRMTQGKVFSILALDKKARPENTALWPDWFKPMPPGMPLAIPRRLPADNSIQVSPSAAPR